MSDKDIFSGRLKVLSIIIVLVVSTLIARMGYLQVYDGEYYANLADGNRMGLRSHCLRNSACRSMNMPTIILTIL